MKNDFRLKAKAIVENFYQECFDIIDTCCSTQRLGHLHFNQTEYVFMKNNDEGKRVPYVHTNNGDVEMHSEDGWWTMEDIGNWADICRDIVLSIAAGCAGHYGYEEKIVELRNEILR